MMMKSKEEILLQVTGRTRLSEFGSYLEDYIEAMQTYADQENAELKEKVEEIGGQSILDTMQRNKALRDEVAELKAEIASLRSRLDECRRKQMMG